MNISKNFTLEQLTRSDIAKRFNFTEQYTPPDSIIYKLVALCNNLLEPVLAAVKEEYPTAIVSITSGYRCKRTNDKAGGTDNSQHMSG